LEGCSGPTRPPDPSAAGLRSAEPGGGLRSAGGKRRPLENDAGRRPYSLLRNSATPSKRKTTLEAQAESAAGKTPLRPSELVSARITQ
jgi:hypothetical protein